MTSNMVRNISFQDHLHQSTLYKRIG